MTNDDYAPPRASRVPFSLKVLPPLALLVGALGAGAWWTLEALVVSQSVKESRTVADLAESVGKWASQYGGLHARTVGSDAQFPGNFLSRAVFTSSATDSDVLQGIRTEVQASEKEALGRLESYFWKNPALIQREVADVITASGNVSRYRLTARTVMNKNNAPTAFDIEALDALQGTPDRSEYWQVADGRMQYARAVVAEKSCLRCHTSPDTTPAFIRDNSMFNGGGGFGYEEGKPVGLISVSVPLVSVQSALTSSVSPRVAGALALAAAALVWLLLALRRRASGV